jgi:hypothetical protein
MAICGECWPVTGTIQIAPVTGTIQIVQPVRRDHTYQELVAEYKRLRAAEGSGVGNTKDTEDAYFAAQVAVQKAIKDANDAWFEVNLLKLHICQNCWDDADVCRVCGADGRQ